MRAPSSRLENRLATAASARVVSALITRMLGHVFGAILALLPANAFAHGMRTAYLEVIENEGRAIVSLKLPTSGSSVAPQLPEGCAVSTDDELASANTRSFVLECGESLHGKTFGVIGLGPVVDEAVLRVVLADGTVLTRLLQRGSASWRLPEKQTLAGIAGEYVALGVEHILTGVDHLLFLLLLVLLVQKPRAVILTETAFTVSHSLSFSATALGWIDISAPAAEAAIALSLLLLAIDVSRSERSAATTAPLIALIFGLVHGLGFAGGLEEIGLPAEGIGVALLGFGLGVELGQILFLAFLLAAGSRLQRLAPALGYCAGVASAFWMIQRIWICFV